MPRDAVHGFPPSARRLSSVTDLPGSAWRARCIQLPPHRAHRLTVILDYHQIDWFRQARRGRRSDTTRGAVSIQFVALPARLEETMGAALLVLDPLQNREARAVFVLRLEFLGPVRRIAKYVDA
jgi:hypothetical protein